MRGSMKSGNSVLSSFGVTVFETMSRLAIEKGAINQLSYYRHRLATRRGRSAIGTGPSGQAGTAQPSLNL